MRSQNVDGESALPGTRFGRPDKRTFSTDSFATGTLLSILGISPSFAAENPSNQTIQVEINHMKMKPLLLTLAVLLSVATAVLVQATSIEATMASINADAKKDGGPARVLQSISASTHVPVATLEKQKAKTNLNYGDLFVAHAIARASGKSFDEIAGMKMKGQSWPTIANANNVSLDGKKSTKKVAADANASASPSPTPMKSLAQEQHDRWGQTHQITNAPKKPKKP